MANALGEWIRQQMYEERIARLKAMSVEELKALWDRYPDNGSSIVDGHDCDEIHLVLNLLGHGGYCAV